MITEESVMRAIVDSAMARSNLKGVASIIPGLISPFIRRLLNNLAHDADGYLEVGTLAGAGVISAAYGNTGNFYAVDDFSYHAGEPLSAVSDLAGGYPWGREMQIPEAWQHHVDKVGVDPTLICMDWKAIEPAYWPQVEVLYYDAGHSFEDTFLALEELPIYTGAKLILIDDYNHGPVQDTVKAWTRPRVAEWTFPTEWNGFYLGLIDT